MNKILVFSIIMFLACFVSAKNNDLILTTDGDSIACEIIEVNDSEIILKMRYDSRNVQTTISRDETSKYEYDVIQEDMYRNKTDTCDNKMYPISSKTYSLENLQNASTEELEYYQFKAEKQKKTGVVISGIGAGSIVLGFALRNAVGKGFRIGKNKDVILNLSALMVFIGAPITITGLSFYFTGTSRVDKIRTINNTAYDNIHIDIDPCAQYNLTTQNYQPGVTLKIKF